MQRTILLALTLIMLAACGAPAAPAAPTEAAAPIIPVLAASELTTGLNRMPFGLLQAGTPLNDPNLTIGVRLFYLDGESPEAPRAEAEAVYRGQGLPVGLYVAYGAFDQPGAWEAELSIPGAGGAPQVSRVRLDVLPEPVAPGVGTQAIASDTLTAADVPELARLTSDPEPDPELYQLSVAEALAGGRPFLVSFATPGYCTSAVCAPNMGVLKELKGEYGAQVDFIHVEVFPYPFGESFQAGERVPAMAEWRLRTEPWTFLVDGEGVIQARYEGGITLDELRPAVAQLAAGQPVDPSGE